MTDQHPPIVSPPQGLMEAWQARIESMGSNIPEILSEVAQWGADQELEACCEWVSEYVPYLPESEDKLRADRRPKPQPELTDEQLISAAEQAGLCYPVCWELRGQDSPRLHHLRRFASAIAAELRGQGDSND